MSSLDLSISSEPTADYSNRSHSTANNVDSDLINELASNDKRRSGRNRKSTSCSLIKINRRTITKPKKHILRAPSTTATEDDIKNIYLNNKIGKFKTTHLETIFEEPKTIKSKLQLTGTAKIKRSLSFSDGYNINKTTVKARRNRIKRLFGSTHKIKKISMNCFMEHFKSLDDNLFETPSSKKVVAKDELLDNVSGSPRPSTSVASSSNMDI